jgi:PPM family protein phosphatase
MSVIIDCYGDTHVGQRRSSNEDQFLIADLNKSMRVHQTSLGLNHHTRLFGGSHGKLMLVADGLGGHESGERAATLAVDGITNYLLNSMDWFFQIDSNNEADFVDGLKEAFQYSQHSVEIESDAIPQRRGMATTLTMGYVSWPELYVVHVGDSRCYHISGKQIRQLTTDHTLAQRLAAQRAASPERKSSADDTRPFNEGDIHILWNVVGGTNTELTPEVSKVQVSVNDSVLLCSDGLTRYVHDNEILDIVEAQPTAKAVCKALIDRANELGGGDNITAVFARFVSPEAARAKEDTIEINQDERPANSGVCGEIDLENSEDSDPLPI